MLLLLLYCVHCTYSDGETILRCTRLSLDQLQMKVGFLFLIENVNKLTDMWRQVIGRPDWCPKKNSKICSKHFTPHDITGERRKRLVSGAVPVQAHHIVDMNIKLGKI